MLDCFHYHYRILNDNRVLCDFAGEDRHYHANYYLRCSCSCFLGNVFFPLFFLTKVKDLTEKLKVEFKGTTILLVPKTVTQPSRFHSENTDQHFRSGTINRVQFECLAIVMESMVECVSTEERVNRVESLVYVHLLFCKLDIYLLNE